MKKIGYILARGTKDLKREKEYLTKHGCYKIFSDWYEQSLKDEYLGFNSLIEHLTKNKIIVIRNLKSLAKSKNHLTQKMSKLHAVNANLLVIEDKIDTTTQKKNIVYGAFSVYSNLKENEGRENRLRKKLEENKKTESSSYDTFRWF